MQNRLKFDKNNKKLTWQIKAHPQNQPPNFAYIVPSRYRHKKNYQSTNIGCIEPQTSCHNFGHCIQKDLVKLHND